MNRKGQAAMEFLMTYGWAIVVVLAAIGALAYFGVLSPQKLLPERTTFQAPLANLDNAVIKEVDNTVEIAFKNNVGVAITVPLTSNLSAATGTTCLNASMSGTYGGSAMTNTTSIPNGANFLLKWDCDDVAAIAIGDKFKADISFAYVNSETTQTKYHTGSVEGKYS